MLFRHFRFTMTFPPVYPKAPSTRIWRFLYPQFFFFFYADTPSVHTCPPYTLGVYGDFCIRSPGWKFLYTLCIRIRVNARIRIFLYQRQGFSARALLKSFEMSGFESDTCGRSYTIRTRYVWTQIFLNPHKKICGYKNLQIRVDNAYKGWTNFRCVQFSCRCDNIKY